MRISNSFSKGEVAVFIAVARELDTNQQARASLHVLLNSRDMISLRRKFLAMQTKEQQQERQAAE